MSKFLRGAHIRGNTEVPLVSVPRITGTVRRDSSGEIAALPLPSTLKVESDLGNASVTFTTSRALNDIVTALNAALAALAAVEDRDGCLSILSLTSGAGGYIRIKAPSSGFPDAAPYFGFRVDPHPLATVAAGDVERAEVRPSTEANPEGTAFVPYGADRTPRAFNRALMRLSKNLDHLHSRMVNPVAMPIALEVDATDVAWAARLTLDANDNVVQMDLSDLAGVDPGLAGRVFVGELDASSSLNAIGACFKILDTDDNEIVAADNRVVRVAAVTRGMRAAAVPTFPDEWSAPVGPLSDTVAVVPDGGNALGVDLVKSAATAISEVLDHATIVVAGATYVTDGVVPGDIVTISGSNIDSPTNHNGTYIVEVVVSEEQLVIRAQDPEANGDLNLGPGILGDAQVSTGGKFQDNVWLTFDPPIPPQQLRDGVSFKVVVGLEKSLGFVSDVEGLILRLFARSSAEVDGFAMRDIRRQLNFGGVYDGQAPRTATGAGGFGVFTRPASLRGIGDGKPTSGVGIRSEVGGSTSGYYLTAAPGDEFTSDDVGRIFLLTDPTYNGLPCLAVQLDGNQRIMLLRLDDSEDGALPTEPAVDYEVRSGAFVEFPALLQARSVADGVTTRGAGFVTLHEVTDTGTVSHKDLGWYGLASLERVVVSDGYFNILGTPATLGALGTDTLAVPFDPTVEPEILAPESDALTAGTSSPHASLIRLLDGPDAGWYRAQKLFAANAIQLAHLDGSAVSFSVGAYVSRIAIYNVAFATNVPLASGKWAAGRFFANWHQVGPGESQDGVVSVGWRGGDENSAGVKIQPNDLDGVGGSGKARGWGVYLVVSDPMTGGYRAEAYDGTVAIALASTPGVAAYPDYTDVLGQGVGFMGSSAGQVGRGPGLWLQTSLWMGRSIIPGATPWDDGAFFTEASAGLGRVAYPGLVGASDSYLGSGGFTGWNAPTRLGHPAVLYPATTGTSQLADIEQPDLAQFAMPHSGILDITGMAGHPPTSLLGCIVEILDGASAAQRHRVIAVSATKVALEGPADVVADEAGASVRVEGARWREAHADLGDWSQVGTGFFPDGGAELPLETLGQDVGSWAQSLEFDETNILWSAPVALVGTASVSGTAVTGAGTAFLTAVDVGDFFKITAHGEESWAQVKSVESDTALTLTRAYSPASPLAAAEVSKGSNRSHSVSFVNGLSAPSTLSPGTVGVGRDAAAMPAVVAGDPTAWGSEWEDDLGEPRAPVPNVGAVTKGAYDQGDTPNLVRGTPAEAIFLSDRYRGDLKVDDFVLDITSNGSATGPFGAFSYFMGGSFLVFNTDGAGTTDGVGLWVRGTGGVSDAFLRATARVVVWRPAGEGDVTLTAELRREDGTLVASAAATADAVAGASPQVLEFEFLNESYLSQPGDAVRAGAHDSQDVHLVLSFALPSSTRAYFGLITLLDGTRARRHHGPQEIVGAVRAQSYRFMRPVKGYDTVGPERVDLLEFAEYAKQEQFGSEEGYRAYVERQGIGKIYDVTPGEERWLQPTYPRQSFFSRGPSVAVIRGTHPFHDPIWYAQAVKLYYAQNPAVLDLTKADHLIWPGRTGFFGEIRIPHGAVLSTLHGTLSFVPQFDSSGNATFMVWNFFDSMLSDGATQFQLGKKSSWDANEGFTIRIWRKHVLDVGIEFDGGTPLTEMAGSPTTPAAGYAEVIWEKDYDLSSVTEPTAVSNGGYSSEHTVRISEDLLSQASAADLRADRRHYSYSFTVEFWIGSRRLYNDGVEDRYYYGSADGYVKEIETAAYFATPPGFLLRALGSPPRADAPGSEEGSPTTGGGASPPEAKYRALRFGWLTDRVGDGFGG